MRAYSKMAEPLFFEEIETMEASADWPSFKFSILSYRCLAPSFVGRYKTSPPVRGFLVGFFLHWRLSQTGKSGRFLLSGEHRNSNISIWSRTEDHFVDQRVGRLKMIHAFVPAILLLTVQLSGKPKRSLVTFYFGKLNSGRGSQNWEYSSHVHLMKRSPIKKKYCYS